jgi:hypothetical protein
MANFLMIAMFFVTPPALGPDRAWSLQSTHSSEFSSWEACDDAIRNHLIPAIQSTDTVSVFGWCVPKDGPQKEATKKLNDIKGRLSSKSTTKFNTFMTKAITDEAVSQGARLEELGSCYYYVPPPLSGSNPASGPIVTGILGSCIKSPSEAALVKPKPR